MLLFIHIVERVLVSLKRQKLCFCCFYLSLHQSSLVSVSVRWHRSRPSRSYPDLESYVRVSFSTSPPLCRTPICLWISKSGGTTSTWVRTLSYSVKVQNTVYTLQSIHCNLFNKKKCLWINILMNEPCPNNTLWRVSEECWDSVDDTHYLITLG